MKAGTNQRGDDVKPGEKPVKDRESGYGGAINSGRGRQTDANSESDQSQINESPPASSSSGQKEKDSSSIKK